MYIFTGGLPEHRESSKSKRGGGEYTNDKQWGSPADIIHRNVSKWSMVTIAAFAMLPTTALHRNDQGYIRPLLILSLCRLLRH